ncbi:MAG: carboxypeptidase regulatory-like domain-containing protein [Acidobacteria bacterium]|nr:carboxypeptidase regulatory-like domain-containing protein [Acidobacteriota bacterium]
MVRRTAALLALVATVGVAAQRNPAPPVSIDADDIGGVVAGSGGPEGGVWVIAETTDLPTRFAKIVVTDDSGRFVVPDLPRARYNVWVRGYGLIDSPKIEATPGRTISLTAVTAPTPAAAADYYPAMYWFSMMHAPARREFPLPRISSQGAWLNIIKTGACQSCHALGTPGTRTIPKELGTFSSSVDAWAKRLEAGGARALMARDITRLDTQRALSMFADWTDRIAGGELPFARPERPRGLERNLVVTLWDWSRPTAYLHDAVSTDRRNPRINAGGKVYASMEDSTDLMPILDPRTHAASDVLIPVRDPATPSSRTAPHGTSAYWGAEPIWDSRTLTHNPMMDERGRIWLTSRTRPADNPAFCRQGSDHPSARAVPLDQSNRHLAMYDPATATFTLISTCFPTHHLNFASDADQTLWMSSGIEGGPGVIGWLNRRLFEQTADEQRAQGWTPFIVDTSGNGRRDAYVEAGAPADPAKDTRVMANLYAVAVSPADGAVWGTVVGYPGAIVRVTPGRNPTVDALSEIYQVPAPGFGPRGGDVDRDGVYWVSLASGHLGSFDRRNCNVLRGPSATGAHCPEGWTLHQLPGPQLRDVEDAGSAEASYYTWVDWFDTFGLGRNVPIVMGNLSDSILAFVGGRFVTLRIPYPSGFFPKNVDGRIDDPNGGWKGKGLWSTSGTRTMFHLEGGKENRPKAARFQLRPGPLAK